MIFAVLHRVCDWSKPVLYGPGPVLVETGLNQFQINVRPIRTGLYQSWSGLPWSEKTQRPVSVWSFQKRKKDQTRPDFKTLLLTNPELARSPLNPKTQDVQPQLGEAWMPSYISDWVLFLSLILISICLFLPLSYSSCHSLPLSTLYPSSSLPYSLVPLHCHGSTGSPLALSGFL